MSFSMLPLPYAYDALEPYIDARTVEIHYSKHHATYLNNLNAALEKHPQFFDLPIEMILKDLDNIPEDIRTTVRNNGGGYYNHNLYWAIMGPGKGGEPIGSLASAIQTTFGSFSAFKEQFEKAGLGRFGSGWAWLSRNVSGGLVIHSTPNQDTPLAEGLHPIIGVDVWEHAYYLKYQNRRAEYLSNWWNLVDWEAAQRRFEQKS
ncbi:MAG TPA: superoxide dismutase [Anaerolinea thermolimosa]|uniref:Superoxide dismutase n=1 Tax=Anaerolinea thermolimosa TaxID=229919 RepID=A0A3D1JI19_9CHLR|nr:superoxide dismutase [Anaerolinea thermolimosa]GAP07019.1 superoxide dismutase [Anaerolinea thermolimosa]HCE18133.1 superoxide dismutase [Anaerolinea thermolimosa]